jgi:hypothetical protein
VISNTGTTTLTNWALKFTFANGQAITQLMNGSYTQSNGTVTVTNLCLQWHAGSGRFRQSRFQGKLERNEICPERFYAEWTNL